MFDTLSQSATDEVSRGLPQSKGTHVVPGLYFFETLVKTSAAVYMSTTASGDIKRQIEPFSAKLKSFANKKNY
jgi:hypothetical protein